MKTFIAVSFIVSIYLGFSRCLGQYTFDNPAISAFEDQTIAILVTYTPTAAPPPAIVQIIVDYPNSKAAGNDFAFLIPNPTLDFTAGHPLTQLVAIKINKDDLEEAAESIVLKISVAGIIQPSTSTVTIGANSTGGNFLDSLYAAFGGNINFRERKLLINSIYSDITYSLKLKLLDKEQLYLYMPLRLFFNNGSGPVQTENANMQRFFTIDTNFIENGVKKVKYWDDRPYVNYKTETTNLGMNIPILLSLETRHPNIRYGVGYNFDMALMTIRNFDYAYTDFVTISRTVDKLSNVPLPRPDTTKFPDGSFVVQTNQAFFSDSLVRPTITIPNRTRTYFQTHHGLSFFIVYDTPKFYTQFRYVIGNTVNYWERRNAGSFNNYKHTVQLQIWQRTGGIKLFVDARLPGIKKGIADGYPNLYISLSKTINFGDLAKAVF